MLYHDYCVALDYFEYTYKGLHIFLGGLAGGKELYMPFGASNQEKSYTTGWSYKHCLIMMGVIEPS